MKKFFALFLALIMALSLVACGGGKTEEPKDRRAQDRRARKDRRARSSRDR